MSDTPIQGTGASQRRASEPSPPTVQQDTAVPRQPSPPTVHQPGVGRPPSPPTVEQTGVAADADATEFPRTLLDRYDPLEVCGMGTEAVVWHVRRRGDGQELAVKHYFAGKPVDEQLLARLRDPRFRRHVPEIHESGRILTAYGERAWVALEYLPRTFADVIAAERLPGRGLPLNRAKEHLAELAATLHFWQDQIEGNPLDFKPDNLLVRESGRDRRVELVISDFGGVAGLTMSQQVGPVMAAVAYMAPEERWGERAPRSPWWSLGEIAFELTTGRARFRREDGSILPDQVIQRDRVIGRPDLSPVPDERWRLLVAGLLTRAPEDRWDYRQVSEWLAGGSPAVVQERPEQASRAAHRPITFIDGRTFQQPAELAVAMLDSWHPAANWLTGDGRQRLLDWLDEVDDNRFDTGHLRGIANRPERAHLAVTAFGATFAPRVRPRYQGQLVDEEGLTAILNEPDRFGEVRALLDGEVLAIAAQYSCERHPGCAGRGGCAVLERVVRELPDLVVGVGRATADAGRSAARDAGGGTAWQPTAGEWDIAYGFGVLLTLQPGSKVIIRREIGPLLGARPSWWRELRAAAGRANPATVDGRVALVTAAVLHSRALAEQGQARSRTANHRMEQARSWWLLLAGVGLAIVAMALMVWAGAVCRFAVDAKTADIAAIGKAVGGTAARWQYRLLPLVVLVAVEAALLSRVRSEVLYAASVSCGVVGYLAAQLPAFTLFQLPAATAQPLVRLGASWDRATGPVAVGYAVASLLLCTQADRLVRMGAGRDGPVSRLGGSGAPLRGLPRVGAAPLLLAVLLAVLWVAVTVRLTATAGLPSAGGARIGAQAARLQSDYLPVFAVLALLACLRRPGRGHGILILGVVAAASLGLWTKPVPAPVAALRFPAFDEQLAWVAARWGDGVLWATVLLYVPVAVLGVRLAYDRLRSP
jgi:serine/threonine protein kinase